jgi:hypothetical protein
VSVTTDSWEVSIVAIDLKCIGRRGSD